MRTGPDRQVHAVASGVFEVVRYERAGKWHIEVVAQGGEPRRRLQVGLRYAAAAAVVALQRGGHVSDASGGSRLRSETPKVTAADTHHVAYDLLPRLGLPRPDVDDTRTGGSGPSTG